MEEQLKFEIQSLSGMLELIMYEIRELKEYFNESAKHQQRPSTLHKPIVTLDGNMFTALYGSNLQEGCFGAGRTRELAMLDFDSNWNSELAPAQIGRFK